MQKRSGLSVALKMWVLFYFPRIQFGAWSNDIYLPADQGNSNRTKVILQPTARSRYL